MTKRPPAPPSLLAGTPRVNGPVRTAPPASAAYRTPTPPTSVTPATAPLARAAKTSRPSAEELFDRLVERGLDEVVLKIAVRRHVTVDEILGSDRHASIAAARHEFFATLRALGFSLVEVGRLLHVDHTTVMSGARRHAVRSCKPAPPLVDAPLVLEAAF